MSVTAVVETTVITTGSLKNTIVSGSQNRLRWAPTFVAWGAKRVEMAGRVKRTASAPRPRQTQSLNPIYKAKTDKVLSRTSRTASDPKPRQTQNQNPNLVDRKERDEVANGANPITLDLRTRQTQSLTLVGKRESDIATGSRRQEAPT